MKKISRQISIVVGGKEEDFYQIVINYEGVDVSDIIESLLAQKEMKNDTPTDTPQENRNNETKKPESEK